MFSQHEKIEINPNIHFGKPFISGTRILVLDVLELVSEGISFDKIILDYYPNIQTEDIRACIRYAMEIVAVEDVHILESA
ncbi:DUF433 domain-containing protein [Candidatus Desantisbacteria bacterium]|nr:DUF433 domain-containing protein [Candidatus Desantisbacteria bacterium]